MDPADRIIVALDVCTLTEVDAIICELGNTLTYKVGLELISSVGGPQTVEHVHSLGARVFYDGKFSDIPNTVGMSARAVSSLGVHMFTVHTTTEAASLRAAVQNRGSSLVLGVTLLTSFVESNITNMFGADRKTVIQRLARIAIFTGVNGIVCSATDLPYLRDREFEQPFTVTPGIRPVWSEVNDQKSIATPVNAIRAGADYLVIGRPITHPPHGMSLRDAYERVVEEISTAP